MSSDASNALRLSRSGVSVSLIHVRGITFVLPRRPLFASTCPNRARSRSVAHTPPSAIALPCASTVISASNSAPIGCQRKREISSARRIPLARSITHASMSVRIER